MQTNEKRHVRAANEQAKQLEPILRELSKSGATITEIIRELNRRNIPAFRGKPWCHNSVKNLMKRLNLTHSTVRRGIKNHLIHGYSVGEGLPTYQSYKAMLQRCYNLKCVAYKNYGARGIEVCFRWLHGSGDLSDFQCFLADMGAKPTPRHTLDRYPDNNGDYEPNNCRWIPKEQQGWSALGKKRRRGIWQHTAEAKARIGTAHTKRHLECSSIDLKS
jgi:hypothetical protein